MPQQKEYSNITIRLPAQVVERLRELAQRETEATKLKVTVNSVVHRALVEDLEKRVGK